MEGNKTGYVILRILAVVLAVAAVLTLIPYPAASKASWLGYNSLCSFAPASTIALLLAAGAVCLIRRRLVSKAQA